MRSAGMLGFFIGFAATIGVGVTSCSPYPHLSYYEMEDRLELPLPPEERQYYEDRMAHIETQVLLADEFLLQLDACFKDRRCIPVCMWSYMVMDEPFNFYKHDISDMEKKYKWWMRVKPPTCFFQLRDRAL